MKTLGDLPPEERALAEYRRKVSYAADYTGSDCPWTEDMERRADALRQYDVDPQDAADYCFIWIMEGQGVQHYEELHIAGQKAWEQFIQDVENGVCDGHGEPMIPTDFPL